MFTFEKALEGPIGYVLYAILNVHPPITRNLATLEWEHCNADQEKAADRCK